MVCRSSESGQVTHQNTGVNRNMERTNETLWQTKLAARLHDPVEKALVLLRDPAGHENGTSKALIRLLGYSEIGLGNVDPDNDDALAGVLFKKGIPADMYRYVQRADWWAAAADRPQWPMEEVTVTTRSGDDRTFKVASWAQVRWTNKPVLIHPLTGRQYDLGKHGGLADTDFKDIKQRSFDHFSRLLTSLGEPDSDRDWRRTLLAFWRFGPDLIEEDDSGHLGPLWRLLPADTRVPDHSIWDHLDLTSAFAGAFAADPNEDVALLTISIGPVQSFIAAARTMSDLWAGSHLLSRLAWETMKSVCERLGPDAILFPRLRGIPQVDLWLRDEIGLPAELFRDCEWTEKHTDANPLFSASLPNRFVALVPASQAADIAREARTRVCRWLHEKGKEVVDRLLEEIGEKPQGAPGEASSPAYEQMRNQLEGFPEVHWTTVPFSLVRPRNRDKQTDLALEELVEAMAPFYGEADDSAPGFLGSSGWQAVNKVDWSDGTTFFRPNPGVVYPAIYDLAERILASAKSVRPFSQSEETGWRCSLTGETEWLTTDRRQLRKSYRNQTETLWARVAECRPSWARKGEHLGALPALKRLWPNLFAEEVANALGSARSTADRFVVSTHTMAIATSLERLDNSLTNPDSRRRIEAFVSSDDRAPALPRGLARLRGGVAARVPAALDRLRESDEPEDSSRLRELETELKSLLGHRPEAYFALLLMDGDHMGRILSGDSTTAISYRDSFHPDVRKGFDEHAKRQDLIRHYGETPRALAPNRHLAISGALNDFSMSVVPHVVEREFHGRVIYAGGDDVLAMTPVADLLSTMARLRQAYSGHDHRHAGGTGPGLVLREGFALLDGRLMRMMGETATASCGAVIAHHQSPLIAVMRELRAAESRAKTQGGRDAFDLTIIKRSGGALRLTAKWGEPLELLIRLRDFLAEPDVSRRAVYNSALWLKDLPEPTGDGDMVATMLASQLARQTRSQTTVKAFDLAGLAARLVIQAIALSMPGTRLAWIETFLSTAEFLSRETRFAATANNSTTRRASA